MKRRLARLALGASLRVKRLFARPPRSLRLYERKVFSQNGEDGVIEEIFRRVGVTNKFFVEFGVQTGVECNAARLARQEGWSGLFMECDLKHFRQLAMNYIINPRVKCVRTMVASSNIEELLEENGVPHEPDLLSIDIDGNDYWVWAAINRWRPRVVVIEYNANHRPPKRWVMAENILHRWDGTGYYGASLASLAALGERKGYTLVATEARGVNAFFVRSDLAGPRLFRHPGDVEIHYSPPNYGPENNGHPHADGPYAEV